MAVPDTKLWPHPMLRVQNGKSRPAEGFAAVQYRNHWFWIDDRDWRSKRTFSTILFLFTLADNAGPAQGPVITIPAH